MAFLGGWPSAAFTVLNQQRAAGAQGRFEAAQLQRQQQIEDEERKRQQELHALQMALTQGRIDEMQRPEPPQEWKPTTYEDAVRYYRETHPEKPEAPRNIDPNSPEGIRAALRRKRGERKIELDMPLPEKPKEPKEWDEPGYRAKRMDELTTPQRRMDWEGNWQESPAMSLDEAQARIDQEVARIRGGAQPAMPSGQARVDKTISDYLRTRKNAVLPTPATQPTESVTPMEQSTRRVITQDQMEYLKATGKWDPTLYEVGE